jgi:hypothetical protein
MLQRATTTLALELNKTIDPNNCTEPEKEVITMLAADETRLKALLKQLKMQ